jgi:hypothetical protein
MGRPRNSWREARELKLDPGAPLGRAPSRHPPAVGLRDRTHDRESQARSAGDTVARDIGAMETVENALALVDGDARAIVFHEES